MTNPNGASENDRKARQRLSQLHGELRSWGAVSRSISNGQVLNRGLLSAVARGARQPTPQVLKALGLPVVKHMPAPVCARCGVVHVRKTCPNGSKAARPRRRYKAELNAMTWAVLVLMNAKTGVNYF